MGEGYVGGVDLFRTSGVRSGVILEQLDRSRRDSMLYRSINSYTISRDTTLQKQPDATATVLLDRLIRRHPDRFSRRQLRTLQRRVGQWRSVMASQLVYVSAQRNADIEANLGGIGPVGDN